MDKELYETYVRILNKELVTAMGCTEPIAMRMQEVSQERH